MRRNLSAYACELAGTALMLFVGVSAVAADIEGLLEIDLDGLDQPVRARGRIAHAAREAKVALATCTGSQGSARSKVGRRVRPRDGA